MGFEGSTSRKRWISNDNVKQEPVIDLDDQDISRTGVNRSSSYFNDDDAEDERDTLAWHPADGTAPTRGLQDRSCRLQEGRLRAARPIGVTSTVRGRDDGDDSMWEEGERPAADGGRSCQRLKAEVGFVGGGGGQEDG
jgi:hypothetical protein